MSERIWSPSQKEALQVRGRDTLVSAAAGSGKTSVLCQRILDRLTDKENPLDLGRLLVVTFTNAAAAEMRARLQKEIATALAKHPTPHLRRQAMLLHRANICTIDKYCIRFVKTHFHLLGISPDVTVAEDSALSEVKRRIMQRLIDEFYQNEPAFAATSDLFITDRDEKNFPDILTTLHRNLMAYADGVDAILHVAEEMERASELSIFEGTWGTILKENILEQLTLYRCLCLAAKEQYSAATDKKGNPIGQELDGDLQMISDLYTPLSENNAEAFFDALSQKGAFGRRTLPLDAFGKCFTDYGRKRFKDAFQDASSLGLGFSLEESPLRYRQMANHCRMLHKLLSRYDAELLIEKKRLNMLEFSDMERMTLSLLENPHHSPSEMALSLKNEFDEIFIDEYQDVNDIQNRIFNCLSQGNRFLVGDVKQSIYGFRYADPTIFSSLRNCFADYEQTNAPTCRIFMQNNFRCDKSVVDFTNTVCASLFPHCPGLHYLPEDALQYAKTAPDRHLAVEVHITKQNDDFFPQSENAEAAFLASRIATLIEEGTKPADIAILCRSVQLDSVRVLTEELQKRAIPAAISGLNSFFEESEVQLCLAFVRAVDNPTNDIPLAAILRSPLFGYSDTELIFLAQNRAETLWGKLHLAAETGDAKAALVIKTLETNRRLAAEEGVDALLFSLFENPAFSQNADSEAAQTAISERLEYLYGIALGTPEIGSFLARIERMKTEGIRDRKDRDQNCDKVRIMTIHGSKGLEFPVCCLFGCGKYLATKSLERSDFDPHLGPAIPLKDPTGMAFLASAQETARQIEAKGRDIAEEMRILYVAMTRAQNHLIITGTPKTASIDTFLDKCRLYAAVDHPRVPAENPSYLAWILIALFKAGVDGSYGIYQNGELYLGTHNQSAAPSEEEESEFLSPVLTANELQAVDEKLKKRLQFVYPHQVSCMVPAKLSVSTLKEDLLDDESNGALLRSDAAITLQTPQFLQEEENTPSPALIGSATHKVMQFLDFENALANGVEAEMNRLLEKGFLSAAEKELADKKAITAFFTSDIYKEMRSARAIYRERRFMITLPISEITSQSDSSEELLVQGVIDCFFFDSEGKVWLVDYKTDHFPKNTPENEVENELIRRHKEQMYYYRLALGRLCGREVSYTRIYSFHLGRSVSLDEIERKDLL
jgi:ATP-dependent helicase/nuclease subunit A